MNTDPVYLVSALVMGALMGGYSAWLANKKEKLGKEVKYYQELVDNLHVAVGNGLNKIFVLENQLKSKTDTIKILERIQQDLEAEINDLKEQMEVHLDLHKDIGA